jgi:hypothetical protein
MFTTYSELKSMMTEVVVTYFKAPSQDLYKIIKENKPLWLAEVWTRYFYN